jgi:hypothetical protein
VSEQFNRDCGSSKGLSGNGIQALRDMFRHKKPTRDPDEFCWDRKTVPGPVKSRSEELIQVFANQSELDLYKFCNDAKLSLFRSEQLLAMVSKV